MSGRQDNVSFVSSTNHKRPVSVGVCPLVGIIGAHQTSSQHQITETIKMFSCDEKDFHQLHSMIIKGSGKISPANVVSGPATVTVTMRVFTGLVKEVRDQNQNLFTVVNISSIKVILPFTKK